MLLAAASEAERFWPQWRGPTNNGLSLEKGLPDEWGESKNVRWKLKTPGPGGSRARSKASNLPDAVSVNAMPRMPGRSFNIETVSSPPPAPSP